MGRVVRCALSALALLVGGGGAAEPSSARESHEAAIRSAQAGETLRLGFALWWRILLSSIRFVWIPLVLGLAIALSFRRRTAESLLTVLELVLFPLISIAAMGLGSRLLTRQRQIEAGDYVPGGKPRSDPAASSVNPYI